MKQKIIVNLEQSPDFKALWEVTDIVRNEEQIESCDLLSGLFEVERLEIGSWVRKSELTGLKGLRHWNKHLKFQISQAGEPNAR